MSGGHFEYNQYKIDEIKESILDLTENNNVENEYGESNTYSKETLDEFKTAIVLLKKARIYSQRIDWLICGDDSEETFHERLKEDLEEEKLD